MLFTHNASLAVRLLSSKHLTQNMNRVATAEKAGKVWPLTRFNTFFEETTGQKNWGRILDLA